MDYHSLTREKLEDKFAERLRYEQDIWEHQKSSPDDWQFAWLINKLTEDPLLICCTIVFSYILYFVFSFFFKSNLQPTDLNEKGLSAYERLLAAHSTSNSVSPTRMKNLYEIEQDIKSCPQGSVCEKNSVDAAQQNIVSMDKSIVNGAIQIM